MSVGKDLVVYYRLVVELGAMSYDNPFVGDVSLHVGGDVRGPAAEDERTYLFFLYEIGNNFTGGIAVSIDGSVRARNMLSHLALFGWSKLRGDVTLTIGGALDVTDDMLYRIMYNPVDREDDEYGRYLNHEA